jgi:hypothetical protein
MSKNVSYVVGKRRNEKHFDRNRFKNSWRRVVSRRSRRNVCRMNVQSSSRRPRICLYLNQLMMRSHASQQVVARNQRKLMVMSL